MTCQSMPYLVRSSLRVVDRAVEPGKDDASAHKNTLLRRCWSVSASSIKCQSHNRPPRRCDLVLSFFLFSLLEVVEVPLLVGLPDLICGCCCGWFGAACCFTSLILVLAVLALCAVCCA